MAFVCGTVFPLLTACVLVELCVALPQLIQRHNTSQIAYVFSNSPKLWFQYILEFLEMQLVEKTLHLNLENSAFLQLMAESSGHLVSLSFARINVAHCCTESWTFYNPGGLNMPCNKAPWLSDKNMVLKASGKLFNMHLPSEPILKTKSNPKCYFYDFVWIFDTHRRFHTFLTFHTFLFSSQYFQCHMGKLVVFNSHYKDDNFTYCGTQAAFNLCPAYSSFVINITTYLCIEYKVVTYFSVQDAGLIHSIHTRQLSENNDLISSILVAREDIQLTFLFQVAKAHLILLQIPHHPNALIGIFDGPSTVLFPLKFTGELFLSSTFQCMIQILTELKFLYEVGNFSYQPQLPNITRKVQVYQNKTIHFHGHGASKTRVLKVSSRNYFLNISIDHLSAMGMKEDTCSFCGLLVAEFLPSGFHENPTVCSSHDGTVTQSRSFYSHTASVIVLFYWYFPLCNISTKLFLSVSKCELVQINKTQIHDLCTKPGAQNSHFSPKRKLIDKTVQVTYKDSWEIFLFYANKMDIETSQTCFIIQFPDLTDSCDFFLFPEPISKPDVIHLTLRGAVQHKFTSNNTDCLLKRHTHDRGLFNTYDVATFPMKTSLHNKGTKRAYRHLLETIITFPNQWGPGDIRNYFYSIRYTGPTRHRHLKVFCFASFWAQHSWMELVVHTRHVHTRSRRKYSDIYFSAQVHQKVTLFLCFLANQKYISFVL